MRLNGKSRISVPFEGWRLRAFLFALFLSAGILSTFKTRPAYPESVNPADSSLVERPSITEGRDYTQTEILVKFTEEARPKQVLRELGIKSKGARRLLPEKEAITRMKKGGHIQRDTRGFYNVRGRKYAQLEDAPQKELFAEAYTYLKPKEKDLFRWHLVVLEGEQDIPALVEAIKLHPAVEEAQPNHYYVPYQVTSYQSPVTGDKRSHQVTSGEESTVHGPQSTVGESPQSMVHGR